MEEGVNEGDAEECENEKEDQREEDWKGNWASCIQSPGHDQSCHIHYPLQACHLLLETHEVSEEEEDEEMTVTCPSHEAIERVV